MKRYRLVAAGLLLVALSSCSAFLAPSKGRWNPLDPTKDADTSLSVTEAGWVPSGGIYSTGTFFYVSLNDRGVLRFPFSQVGVDLVHAELEIYLVTDVSPAVEIGVRAIIMDFSTSSLSWTQLITSGFTSTISSPGMSVLKPGLYHIDVTNLFTSLGASAIKGLVVETTGATSLEFRASRYGTYPPKLLLWNPKW